MNQLFQQANDLGQAQSNPVQGALTQNAAQTLPAGQTQYAQTPFQQPIQPMQQPMQSSVQPMQQPPRHFDPSQQNPFVAQRFMQGLKPEERRDRMSKIIWSHKEILTGDEAKEIDKWQSIVIASALAVGLIQIPLTIRYGILMRRDLEKHRYLAWRLLGLAAFNFPFFTYSANKAEGLASDYADKYLSDLTDFELCNFEDIYLQMKQQAIMESPMGQFVQQQEFQQRQVQGYGMQQPMQPNLTQSIPQEHKKL